MAVEPVPEFLTRDNASRLVAGCDAVLNGLDNIESRKILAASCGEAGIPYVFGAIAGWVIQTGVILPGEPILDILYPAGSRIPDKSALSFTPAACAAIQSAQCVCLLVGRPAESGVIRYLDLLNNEFESIPLGSAAIAFTEVL